MPLLPTRTPGTYSNRTTRLTSEQRSYIRRGHILSGYLKRVNYATGRFDYEYSALVYILESYEHMRAVDKETRAQICLYSHFALNELHNLAIAYCGRVRRAKEAEKKPGVNTALDRKQATFDER